MDIKAGSIRLTRSTQIDINPVAAVEGIPIAVGATVILKTDFKKDIKTNV